MLQNRKKTLGQGMTEYIIIVALIAIAAIAVYSLFGKTVKNQVAGMAKELSGQSGSSELDKAKGSADAAGQKAGADNTSGSGLGTYTGQSQ